MPELYKTTDEQLIKIKNEILQDTKLDKPKKCIVDENNLIHKIRFRQSILKKNKS